MLGVSRPCLADSGVSGYCRVSRGQAPAARYLEWMQRGLHIITPNKKLNSGPLERYLALRQFQRESYIHYFYEVGLGDALSARCQCWSGLMLSAAQYSKGGDGLKHVK